MQKIIKNHLMLKLTKTSKMSVDEDDDKADDNLWIKPTLGASQVWGI